MNTPTPIGRRFAPVSFLVVAAALVLLNACKHERLVGEEGISDPNGEDPGQEQEPVDTCDPNTAYFTQEVLPIFIQSCTMSGCHNTATDDNDEIRLTDYASIMNAFDDEDVWEVINEDDEDDVMPPDSMNPLTPEQIATIGQWLQQGAQNNSCESGCDTSAVTYSGTIFPIIQSRCLNCHSGSNPQGGLDLASWSVLNSVATDGRLAGAIQHLATFEAMPPSGPMLSACRIDQVLTWIQNGAPNN